MVVRDVLTGAYTDAAQAQKEAMSGSVGVGEGHAASICWYAREVFVRRVGSTVIY